MELAELCVLLHGKGPATRMLDPFLGIGSASLAALKRGIDDFTGIELDGHYLATARERIQSEIDRRASELPL